MSSKSPSQFELAREALRIEKPPNNVNLGWSSSPSYGTRSPSSPYTPPVFNRLKSSYASVGKNVPPSFRKSRKASRKNRKGSRRANRKSSRKNRKSSRKNRN
jgi:hypothetical protein